MSEINFSWEDAFALVNGPIKISKIIFDSLKPQNKYKCMTAAQKQHGSKKYFSYL